MPLLSELRLLGLVAALLAAFGGFKWFEHQQRDIGRAEVQAKWDQSKAAQVLADRQATEALAEQATLLRKARDAEKDRINLRLADALGSLRNRPDRVVPGATASAATGATGRELYREDAEFLVRIASEADQCIAALAERDAWIKAVRK